MGKGRLAETTQAALQLASLYWGSPDWQGGFLLLDDSNQWEIYDYNCELLERNETAIKLKLL